MRDLTPEQLRALDEGAFKDRMSEEAALDRARSPAGTTKDVVVLARRALLAAMRVDDGNGDRAALTQTSAQLAAAAMRMAVEGSALLPKTHFAPGSLSAVPSSASTTEDARQIDPIGCFLADRVRVGVEEDFVDANVLFQGFTHWTVTHRLPTWSLTGFTRAMQERGFKIGRRRPLYHSRLRNCWRAIVLLPPLGGDA